MSQSTATSPVASGVKRGNGVRPDAQQLAALGDIGNRLLQLVSQLKKINPERDFVFDQILLALLTREHTLIYGPTGTGKTYLAQMLFGSFEGATVFQYAMSKQTTEAHLYGPINVKLLREDGHMRYNTAGTIVEADFAEMDEFLDGPVPLLRALLGIFHERQFKKGAQQTTVPLHTAVACTNIDPELAVKQNPELAAVVDRFLFQARVDYLTDGAARRRMYSSYLAGEQPLVSVTLQELRAISNVVVEANQITDADFIATYDQVIQDLRKAYAGKLTISDRKACKMLGIVEARALLLGRFDVHPEDIVGIRYALFHDDKEFPRFDEVTQPVIQKAIEGMQTDIDKTVRELIEQLSKDLPPTPTDASDGALLVQTRRQLEQVMKSVKETVPKLASTFDQRQALLDKIAKRMETVDHLIHDPAGVPPESGGGA